MTSIKLRRIATSANGAGFPHAYQGKTDGDLPFFKVSDFNLPGNERYLSKCTNWITRSDAVELGARLVPPESILLPKVGAALLGNARRIVTRPSLFDNNILAIVPRIEDSRYLHYWATTIDAGELSYPGPVPSLTGSEFLDLLVPIQSVPHQRAIADFLDDETARIDALIAKKRQLVRLLGTHYREERRMRMLRGLNPITGSGLNVPDWRVAQLGVLVGLQRGHDLPIDRRNDGTVPVISSGGPSGWHDEAEVMGPGVVTGRYGTVGEVYYVDGPYWPLNTTLYVRDFRGRYPKWVYHLLSVLPLDSDSAKSAVTGINRNVIGVLRVPVPPPDEQRRLVRELDAKARYLESVTSRLDAQITLLAEHRQALITAAVTGQIEVPGVAAR